VLRQYHTLATSEAGRNAKDAALRAHAKVLRGYHNKSSIGVSFVGMINASLFQSSPNLGIDWRTTDYKGVKSAPGGMAARDTALRAYAKVLRQYHKEATYLSSSSCS